MSTWHYDDWFGQLPPEAEIAEIVEAENYLTTRAIEKHPFFDLASNSKKALACWVTQELVVTGPFSQLLLNLSGAIKNVHLRALILGVAIGEHGRPGRGDLANHSHPWLLHTLRESMGIATQSIQPLPETEEFLAVLEDECCEPIRALAALGLGNERMLIPEYTAVKTSFEHCWPSCEYEAFLNANIGDDLEHWAIMRRAACTLVVGGSDPKLFLKAGKRSVDARHTFYDRLLERLS